jgi:ABC-type phosphate/phosphonate transport system substrate-binding protein
MKIRSKAIFSCALCCMAFGGPDATQAQGTITFLEVALDEETRQADERLRRYLATETGNTFVPERPLEYSLVVDRLASWNTDRGWFIARTTPYAFVAAEMLGAQLDGLATYVSTGGGGTTYHAWFVVSRARFNRAPDLASLVDYLRTRTQPASFAYHSKFSTSSYFLPALFFRSHGIFNMPEATQYHTAIHTHEVGSSSSDLVRMIADGQYDVAAVWDATKSRFEDVDSLFRRYGSRVHFIRLPTPLPNDLLVVSAAMDSASRSRIQGAIRRMSEDEISQGDFRTWRDINDAPDAREALANLRWLAREQPPAITVDVRRSERGTPLSDRLLEAARQAVRLSATEFVNYDDDFHAHRDSLWTLEHVRDGSVALTSRIVGSDVEDQRFWISFSDEEDLTRRIGAIIHGRMHRVRYVWPYRPERPTVVRDVAFAMPPGSPVRVRRIHWLDAQRNYFQQDAEFEARVEASDFFKLELGPNFVAPAQAGFGFDPMSNISYRVILIRPATESLLFRGLTVALVLLLAAAAAAAVLAHWRRREPLV